MIRLLALLLLALPAAAGTLDGCFVGELNANAVKITCVAADNVGDAAASSLASGSDPSSMTHSANNPAASNNDGNHHFSWYDAEGGETRYYQIIFDGLNYTCPVICTNCTSADDALFADTNTAGLTGSGLNCPVIGEAFELTHPADATPDPVAPVHTLTPDQVYAQFDCAVVTCVTTDGVAGSAVETTYTSVKDDGNVQIIRVDPTTTWTLEKLTSLATHTSDFVLIEPDTAITITDRGRAGPEHSNHMLHIVPEFNAEHETQLTGGSTASLYLPNNFALRQVWIHDEPKPQAPRQYDVTAVTTGTRRVTVDTGGVCPEDSATGTGVGNGWWMLNLPGVTGYSVVDLTVTPACSAGEFRFTTGTWGGTYTSGGTLTRGSTHVVSSVSTDNPAQVTFAHNHGFPDPTTVAVDFVYVGNVEGAGCSGINGTHKYTVIDADTIALTGVDGSGCTYSASDWDFVRSNLGYRAYNVSVNSRSNAWILQSVIGNVWYGQSSGAGTINMGLGSNVGFLDGTILSGGNGMMLDPDTDLPVFAASANAALPDNFRMDGCRDCQVRNFQVLGPTPTAHINFQDGSRPPHDITIEAGTISNLRRAFSGPNFSDVSLGLWQLEPRGCVEGKGGGHNFRINGLECLKAAQGSAYSTTGWAMFFAISGADLSAESREWKDLYIGNSLINGYSSGINIGAQTAQGGIQNHGINERILWENNIFAGVLNTTITEVPPSTSTTTPLGIANGYTYGVRIGMSDFQVLRNTSYSNEGGTSSGCRGFYFDAWRSPDAIVQGNIFPFHCASGNGFASFTGLAPNFLPYTGTSSATRFASWAPHGDCTGNLFLAGVEDPSNVATDKSSSDNADTKTSTEWDTAFSGDPCAVEGPDDATYAARHTALFGSDFMADAPYTAYGVEDYDSHRRARGRVIAPDKPLQTAPGTLVFNYQPNTTAKCSVRTSENGFASSQTVTEADATGYSQTVTVTGLTPLATVSAFLECPGGETHSWPVLVLQ